MNWETIGVSVTLSLFSGIIVAYLTMKFALSRFYREKWWEKRADSYIKLTDALYVYKSNHNKLYEHELIGSPTREHALKFMLSYLQLDEIYNENKLIRKEISKLSELGPLVLTGSLIIKLRAFIKEEQIINASVQKEEVSPQEAYDKLANLSSNLLDNIMIEAKKELKIGS